MAPSATSKSTLKADQLSAALTSGDGTLVMNALFEIEEAPVSSALAQLLNLALPKISDTVQAFQVRKTLKVLGLRLTGRATGIGLNDLQKLLKQPDRFEDIAVAFSTLNPTDAVLATDLLRNTSWNELPTPLLPTLCRFFKKYGSSADSGPLIELCRHPDPTVLTTALEALEVVDPSDLPSLVTPLLTSPNASIRAQAIQALYRWDKSAALRHLVQFLFSENSTEQALALHHAVSFPFAEIEPHLLRFITTCSDTRLLMRVSQLMQQNAHPELPFRLYWISRSLREQHQNLIKGIVLGVVRSLADSKKIQGTAQEFLDQLKLRVAKEEERLVKESLSMTAPEAEEKPSGDQAALADLSPAEPELHPVLPPAAGTTPGLPSAAASAAASAAVANLSFDEYDQLDASGRLQLLGRLSPEEYSNHKGRIHGLLKSSKGKELSAVIKVVGRFATSDGARMIKPFLDSENPDAICAAIDALTHLDTEYLGVYLPQLMQSKHGKVRMRATRAFVGIDREQIKSLIAGMLSSSSSRQRAMVIPATMLVDFSLVRDALLKALEKESAPELVEKIGVVLAANPDRELLRAIMRGERHAKLEAVRDALHKVTLHVAEKLVIALGKTSSVEEIMAGEEAALSAEAMLPPPPASVAPATHPGKQCPPGKVGLPNLEKSGPAPSISQVLTSNDDQAKQARTRLNLGILALVGVSWLGMIVYLIIKLIAGE